MKIRKLRQTRLQHSLARHHAVHALRALIATKAAPGARGVRVPGEQVRVLMEVHHEVVVRAAIISELEQLGVLLEDTDFGSQMSFGELPLVFHAGRVEEGLVHPRERLEALELVCRPHNAPPPHSCRLQIPDELLGLPVAEEASLVQVGNAVERSLPNEIPDSDVDAPMRKEFLELFPHRDGLDHLRLMLAHAEQ